MGETVQPIKQYSVPMSLWIVFWLIFPLGELTAYALGSQAIEQGQNTRHFEYIFTGWLVIAFPLVFALILLSLTHTITILPGHLIEFRSIFRRIRIPAHNIISVWNPTCTLPNIARYPVTGGKGRFAFVQHTHGKVTVGEIDGFDEFLNELLILNPQVQVEEY